MSSPRILLLLLTAAVLLLHAPVRCAAAGSNNKIITITNNHTNYLSLRCYSFDSDNDVMHLAPWGQYTFTVKVRSIYPSSTMFNCSTNMGTFVAYKFDYQCSKDKYKSCDWRFDEESAYRFEPKTGTWALYDYAPNYESLNRGGVVKGYFAN